MKKLKQLESGLIALEPAVKKLEQAKSARILILSDSHGYYDAVEEVIKTFGPTCSALCFAGDGVSDIVSILNKALKSQHFSSFLPTVVALVAGNCDKSFYLLDPLEYKTKQEFKTINSIVAPSSQILTVCGHGIFITHGHAYAVESSLKILRKTVKTMNCVIGIFGHVHEPIVEKHKDLCLINPGSLSQARRKSKPGFAIIDIETSKKYPLVSLYAYRRYMEGLSKFELFFKK